MNGYGLPLDFSSLSFVLRNSLRTLIDFHALQEVLHVLLLRLDWVTIFIRRGLISVRKERNLILRLFWLRNIFGELSFRPVFLLEIELI